MLLSLITLIFNSYIIINIFIYKFIGYIKYKLKNQKVSKRNKGTPKEEK